MIRVASRRPRPDELLMVSGEVDEVVAVRAHDPGLPRQPPGQRVKVVQRGAQVRREQGHAARGRGGPGRPARRGGET